MVLKTVTCWRLATAATISKCCNTRGSVLPCKTPSLLYWPPPVTGRACIMRRACYRLLTIAWKGARRLTETKTVWSAVFTVESDHGAFATVRVLHFFDIQLEVDGADNAVAELLMHQRLQRGAVDLYHLIEAVDGRVGGNAAGDAAAQRDSLEQAHRVFIQFQFSGYRSGGCFWQRMLPQQGGSHEGQAQAGAFGDRFKGQVLADFGIQDDVGEMLA